MTKICIGLVIVLTLGASGMAVLLSQNTLIAWWWPVMACVLPAWVIGVMLNGFTGRLTGFGSRLANCVAGSIVMFSVLICTFYSINFYGSSHDTAADYESVIVNKHTEERYRTKRLSRNRTVRGEKYNVYCVVVRLPDSKTRKFEVSAGEYSRVRQGQSLRLHIERGLLGVPVVKDLRLPESAFRK